VQIVHSLDSIRSGVEMTKKKYEAPVLSKAGKLSNLVAVTSKTV
jgi:hypothetical protein